MVTAHEIRAARETLKESQAAFASRFGVDQATVHRWEKHGAPERGTARMAIERLLASLKSEAAE